MTGKLASRKLWVAIGGLLTVIATEFFSMDPVATQSIVDAVKIIAPSYLAGQGIVDAVLAYANREVISVG